MSATQIDGRQIKNLGGDASGTGDAIVVTGLQGVPVTAGTPTTGYVLTFNGTSWAAAAGGGGGGGVGGSGTAGMVPLWSAGTTLTDSLISQLSGAVGVNRVTGTLAVGALGLEVTGGVGTVGDGVAGQTSEFFSFGFNGATPGLGMYHADGPESSPTASQDGDLIGFVGAKGFDGTNYSPGSRAAIEMFAAENFSPTTQGTQIIIRVTATGTTANTNAVMIQAETTGQAMVGINNLSPVATVDINGNIKIADGTQASGYVLTSDGSGLAHWAAPTGGGAAGSLATTGSPVVISGATPPSYGQVLTATSATTANWQTPSGGGGSLPTPTTPLGDILTVTATFGVSISGGSAATTTAGGNFDIEVDGSGYAYMPTLITNFEGSGALLQFSVYDPSTTYSWFIDANNVEGIVYFSNAGTYLGGYGNPTGNNSLLVPDGTGNIWVCSINGSSIGYVGPTAGGMYFSAVDTAAGATFDGTYLWICGNNSTLTAYYTSGPSIGTVYLTMDISSYYGSFSGYPSAIGFDGTNLWVLGLTGASDTTVITEFDTSGTYINQYSTTSFGYAPYYYLIYALGGFWYPNPNGGGLVNVSLSGTFTGFNGGYAYGLSFDGTVFWYTDESNIYVTDGTGLTVGEYNYGQVFPGPNVSGIVAFPGGMYFYESNSGNIATTQINPSLVIGAASDGPTIASEIQSAVNAVVVNSFGGGNQGAYSNFTATYSGTYTLTSGVAGPASSVVVTSAAMNDVAAALQLGVPNGGTEISGAYVWAQEPPAAVTTVSGVVIAVPTNSGQVLITGDTTEAYWTDASNIGTQAVGSAGTVQFSNGSNQLDGNNNWLFFDEGSQNFGILNNNPQYTVDVGGSINFTGNLYYYGSQPFSYQLLADGGSILFNYTSVSGDLTGSITTPQVIALNGVALSNSPSGANEVLVTTSTSAASWQPLNLTALPSWFKTSLTYSSFSLTQSVETIQITSVPAGAVLHGIKIKHSTAFGGGSITAYTVSIGDGTTPDNYASAYDVSSANNPAGSSTYQLTNCFIGFDQGGGGGIYMTATATGDILSNATAGALDVWLLVSQAI